MKKNKLMSLLLSVILIFIMSISVFAVSISESKAELLDKQIVVSIFHPVDKTKLSTLDFNMTFDKANLIFDRAESFGETKCSALLGDGSIRVVTVWTDAAPTDKSVVKLYFNVKAGNADADLSFNTMVNKATNTKNEEIAYEIKTSSICIEAGLVPAKNTGNDIINGSVSVASSSIKKSGKNAKNVGIPKTAGKYIGVGTAFLVAFTAVGITTGIFIKKKKDTE